MKGSTVWFVENPTTLVHFVSYAIENKYTKHYVYLIKDEVDISSEKNYLFRRKLISKLDNVIFLGYRNEFDSLKVTNIKLRKNYFNKEFRDIPNGAIPVFRAGSKYREIYPPWLRSMTIIHGSDEYLLATSDKKLIILRIKHFIRKVICFVDYIFNGKSIFARNIGKKVILKLNYESTSSKNNYLSINFDNKLIKKIYLETTRFFHKKGLENFDNFVNDNFLIAFQPISIKPFEFSIEKVESLYNEFMDHNINSLNNLSKLIKEPISIFVLPHPGDLRSFQHKKMVCSDFMDDLLVKLKKKFENISSPLEYFDPHITYELPYEIIEKILKPDCLLLTHPSATMVTSQLDAEKIYLSNYFKNKNIKYLFRKTNKLYRDLGINLLKNKYFKLI